MIKGPDYKKAESLFYYGNKDSAFYYFNEVVTHPKDSLQVAMSYSYMAAMQSDAGDYFGSQESLLLSLKYLDEKKAKDHYCIAANYNELGVTNLNLNHYDAAIEYDNQALKFAQEEQLKLVVLNNKAVALQKKQQYAAAIRIYDSILTVTQPHTKEYARVLSNLAKTRWLKDTTYNAFPEL
jgi:tetratricopeptide (TPR) repeat protein